MRTKTWRQISLLLASALALAGCMQGISTGADSDKASTSPAHFQHRWAIDMVKVHTNVPTYRDNERFVAAGRNSPLGEVFDLACEREAIIDADGSRKEGECFLWGNTMRVNYDHTPHQEGAENIVNIIDAAGNEIDPPGYLNIIALKHGSRTDQDEVHDNLRNGDILVYFHPEDDDIFQFRMHHAAMYYDTAEGPVAISLGAERHVHHIDNPVSYGPAFNAGVRSVPFHVFRFNPNGAPGADGRDDEGRYKFTCTPETSSDLCPGGPGNTFTITDEMADLYNYQARNWAMLLNDMAPFSSFHRMSWRDPLQRQAAGASYLDEVRRFAGPIRREETPELYCAGLVFTNINLALNMPMNERGLGSDLFQTLTRTSYDFDDNYLSTSFSGSELAKGVESLPVLGQPVFEPITGSRIADEWVEGYTRGLEANITNMLLAAAGGDETMKMHLLGVGVPPALIEQVGGAFAMGGMAAAQAAASQIAQGVARQVRAKILAGAADAISQGFSQLRYQSNKGVDSASSVPVTPARVQAYAQVYGDPLSDNFTIGVNADGTDMLFTPGGDGQPDLQQMKALELQQTLTRYVPPQMYFYEANRPGSLISYVGSVIHVDMLTCIDGALCGPTHVGEIDEFAEGGPDTSLYPHFLVENGKRHVQRIIDVNAGPTRVGHGSRISHRLTAANASDIRLVLHFGVGLTDRYACDRDPACIGNLPGIAVPLNISGPVTDQRTDWDFFKSIEDGGLGCTIDAEGRSCPAFDWATMTASPTERIKLPDNGHGNWTMSVIDLGQDSAGVELPNCSACSEGGAHSNQWFIQVRDDASDLTDPTPITGGDAVSCDGYLPSWANDSTCDCPDGTDYTGCDVADCADSGGVCQYPF